MIPHNGGIIKYETAYHWGEDGPSGDMREMRLTVAGDYIKNILRPEILDIGCGDGYMTNDMARAGRTVTGVDASASGLKFARELSAPSIRYLLAEACKLPFPDNSFDVVTSFDTIEHIENDVAFVLEMKRVLKPRGLVIITTCNRQRIFDHFSKKHWREYSNKELKELLSLGFCCLKTFGVFFYIPLLGIWPPTRTLLMGLGLFAPRMSRGLIYVGEKGME